ncbi:hypothetical protein [Microvirga rosea]|uniref:hypothetical protein n=1 Tax=Microvirga rosea TaxID=2715425 RepID=UPI001D0A7892|nr:hypothetical protein [Microvirga rosea]MCB8823243.1 hypothetical protein [Microvirga rosea]
MIEVHGYAIVSDDDRIADAQGRMPDALRSEADWTYFQQELDRSAATVLGRLGHEAHPNPRSRLRVVVSSSVRDLERRPDGWWWNPAGVSWSEAGRTVLPSGGRVAVPGGRRVFDLFLGIGYTAFHLTRAEGVSVPGGTALFSACDNGVTAETVLAGNGLRPGGRRILDPVGPVSLTVWQR